MNVLVFYDEQKIFGWMVNEPLELAEVHIRNGYPELLEGWRNGTVKAEVIEVPEENAFRSDLYAVIDGKVALKA